MRQVAEDVFEGEGDATRIVAGRAKETGRLVFPLPAGRERDGYDRVTLSQTGTLWSWTVQRFRPKTPFNGRGGETDFAPYAVGYVELPGELIVEGRIVVDDFAALRLGMPMRTTTEAYREDESGTPVLTYAFRPATGEGAR